MDAGTGGSGDGWPMSPLAGALAGGPPVLSLISGVTGAGGSTVAQPLAERFRRMVGGGRVEPEPGTMVSAASQLGLRHRLAAREKTAYGGWSVSDLDRILRAQSPRIGLWLDSSDQDPDETVTTIRERAWTAAVVA